MEEDAVGPLSRAPGCPRSCENKDHRPVLPNKTEHPVQPHSPRLLHVREKGQTALATAAATTRRVSLSRNSSQGAATPRCSTWATSQSPRHRTRAPSPPPPFRRARGALCRSSDVRLPRACAAHTKLCCPLAEKTPRSWSSGPRGLQLGGARGPRARGVCEGSQKTDEKP